MSLLTAIAVGAMFGIGLFQMLRPNVVRSAIGIVLVLNAVNLFLLSAGAYQGEIAAYDTTSTRARSDALPQALVLTAIVIGMGGFAFVLAMVTLLSARYHTSSIDDIDRLKG
jgi:multicomponent Na+:H+ antiporter subunit C